MAIINTIREPFWHTDVADIVSAIHERLGKTDWLKEEVHREILDLLEIEQLPDRVKTWVHIYCQRIISPDLPKEEFTWKLDEPIDKRSLKKKK